MLSVFRTNINLRQVKRKWDVVLGPGGYAGAAERGVDHP